MYSLIIWVVNGVDNIRLVIHGVDKAYVLLCIEPTCTVIIWVVNGVDNIRLGIHGVDKSICFIVH